MKETLSIQPHRLIKTIKFVLYTLEEGEKLYKTKMRLNTNSIVCGLSVC